MANNLDLSIPWWRGSWQRTFRQATLRIPKYPIPYKTPSESEISAKKCSARFHAQLCICDVDLKIDGTVPRQKMPRAKCRTWQFEPHPRSVAGDGWNRIIYYYSVSTDLYFIFPEEVDARHGQINRKIGFFIKQKLHNRGMWNQLDYYGVS